MRYGPPHAPPRRPKKVSPLLIACLAVVLWLGGCGVILGLASGGSTPGADPSVTVTDGPFAPTPDEVQPKFPASATVPTTTAPKPRVKPRVTTTAPRPKPSTTRPKPRPKPKPRPANDPRYRTCAQAKAQGLGPYYRGVDPEYSWYQDRDGDGAVCE
jgi:outer membrane biosynthesis protein TonB